VGESLPVLKSSPKVQRVLRNAKEVEVGKETGEWQGLGNMGSKEPGAFRGWQGRV
jgi:hypothetical protein